MHSSHSSEDGLSSSSGSGSGTKSAEEGERSLRRSIKDNKDKKEPFLGMSKSEGASPLLPLKECREETTQLQEKNEKRKEEQERKEEGTETRCNNSDKEAEEVVGVVEAGVPASRKNKGKKTKPAPEELFSRSPLDLEGSSILPYFRLFIGLKDEKKKANEEREEKPGTNSEISSEAAAAANPAKEERKKKRRRERTKRGWWPGSDANFRASVRKRLISEGGFGGAVGDTVWSR